MLYIRYTQFTFMLVFAYVLSLFSIFLNISDIHLFNAEKKTNHLKLARAHTIDFYLYTRA